MILDKIMIRLITKILFTIFSILWSVTSILINFLFWIQKNIYLVLEEILEKADEYERKG